MKTNLLKAICGIICCWMLFSSYNMTAQNPNCNLDGGTIEADKTSFCGGIVFNEISMSNTGTSTTTTSMYGYFVTDEAGNILQADFEGGTLPSLDAGPNQTFWIDWAPNNACIYGIAHEEDSLDNNFPYATLEELENSDLCYDLSNCVNISFSFPPEYSVSTDPICNFNGTFSVGVLAFGGSGVYILQGLGPNGGDTIAYEGIELLLTLPVDNDNFGYSLFPIDSVSGCGNDYIIPLFIEDCPNEPPCPLPPIPVPEIETWVCSGDTLDLTQFFGNTGPWYHTETGEEVAVPESVPVFADDCTTDFHQFFSPDSIDLGPDCPPFTYEFTVRAYVYPEITVSVTEPACQPTAFANCDAYEISWVDSYGNSGEGGQHEPIVGNGEGTVTFTITNPEAPTDLACASKEFEVGVFCETDSTLIGPCPTLVPVEPVFAEACHGDVVNLQEIGSSLTNNWVDENGNVIPDPTNVDIFADGCAPISLNYVSVDTFESCFLVNAIVHLTVFPSGENIVILNEDCFVSLPEECLELYDISWEDQNGQEGAGNVYFNPEPLDSSLVTFILAPNNPDFACLATTTVSTVYSCQGIICPDLEAIHQFVLMCTDNVLDLTTTFERGAEVEWRNLETGETIADPTAVSFEAAGCEIQEFTFAALFTEPTDPCPYDIWVDVTVLPNYEVEVVSDSCIVSVLTECEDDLLITWVDSDGHAGEGSTYVAAENTAGVVQFDLLPSFMTTFLPPQGAIILCNGEKTVETEYSCGELDCIADVGTIEAVKNPTEFNCFGYNPPEVIEIAHTQDAGFSPQYRNAYFVVDSVGNILELFGVGTGEYFTEVPEIELFGFKSGEFCVYAIHYRTNGIGDLNELRTLAEVQALEGCFDLSECSPITIEELNEYTPLRWQRSTPGYCINEEFFEIGITITGGSGNYEIFGGSVLIDAPIIASEGEEVILTLSVKEANNYHQDVNIRDVETECIREQVIWFYNNCAEVGVCGVEGLSSRYANVCSGDSDSLYIDKMPPIEGSFTWYTEDSVLVADPNNITFENDSCGTAYARYLGIFTPDNPDCPPIETSVQYTIFPDIEIEVVQDLCGTYLVSNCGTIHAQWTDSEGNTGWGTSYNASEPGASGEVSFVIQNITFFDLAPWPPIIVPFFVMEPDPLADEGNGDMAVITDTIFVEQPAATVDSDFNFDAGGQFITPDMADEVENSLTIIGDDIWWPTSDCYYDTIVVTYDCPAEGCLADAGNIEVTANLCNPDYKRIDIQQTNLAPVSYGYHYLMADSTGQIVFTSPSSVQIDANEVPAGNLCVYGISFDPAEPYDSTATTISDVQNGGGCFDLSECQEVEIFHFERIQCSLTSEPVCINDSTFTVGITINGGSGEYEFFGSNLIEGTLAFGGEEVLLTLPSGNYWLGVTDLITGCTVADILMPINKQCPEPVSCDSLFADISYEFIEAECDANGMVNLSIIVDSSIPQLFVGGADFEILFNTGEEFNITLPLTEAKIWLTDLESGCHYDLWIPELEEVLAECGVVTEPCDSIDLNLNYEITEVPSCEGEGFVTIGLVIDAPFEEFTLINHIDGELIVQTGEEFFPTLLDGDAWVWLIDEHTGCFYEIYIPELEEFAGECGEIEPPVDLCDSLFADISYEIIGEPECLSDGLFNVSLILETQVDTFVIFGVNGEMIVQSGEEIQFTMFVGAPFIFFTDPQTNCFKDLFIPELDSILLDCGEIGPPVDPCDSLFADISYEITEAPECEGNGSASISLIIDSPAEELFIGGINFELIVNSGEEIDLNLLSGQSILWLTDLQTNCGFELFIPELEEIFEECEDTIIGPCPIDIFEPEPIFLQACDGDAIDLTSFFEELSDSTIWFTEGAAETPVANPSNVVVQTESICESESLFFHATQTEDYGPACGLVDIFYLVEVMVDPIPTATLQQSECGVSIVVDCDRYAIVWEDNLGNSNDGISYQAEAGTNGTVTFTVFDPTDFGCGAQATFSADFDCTSEGCLANAGQVLGNDDLLCNLDGRVILSNRNMSPREYGYSYFVTDSMHNIILTDTGTPFFSTQDANLSDLPTGIYCIRAIAYATESDFDDEATNLTDLMASLECADITDCYPVFFDANCNFGLFGEDGGGLEAPTEPESENPPTGDGSGENSGNEEENGEEENEEETLCQLETIYTCTQPIELLEVCLACSSDDDILISEVDNKFAGCTLENEGRCLSYRPLPGMEAIGADTISVQYCLAEKPTICSTTSVVVEITEDCQPNTPPIPTDDEELTEQDTPIRINPLGNDMDPDDGDNITLQSFEQPMNGTLTIENGELIYTPNEGFVGVDSFEYTICDDDNACSTAMVALSVMPPPCNDTTYICVEPVTPTVICPTFCAFSEDEAFFLTDATTTFSCSISAVEQTCFRYTALPLSSGIEHIEIIACNAFEVCDTAHIIVQITGCDGSGLAVNNVEPDAIPSTGKHVYSLRDNTQTIEQEGFRLHVYPSPASSTVQIQIADIAYKQVATLQIHDLLGRLVDSQTLELTAGNNRQNIDITDYPNGVYMLSIIGVEQSVTQRFVKQ